jgi:hypothetical protein
MSEMKLAVLGAAGRMGQALSRAIAATEGCVLAAGIETKGSPAIGKDLGEVAGLDPLGIAITDDPLPVFAEVHGVLDFTTPRRPSPLPGSRRRRASSTSSARRGSRLKTKPRSKPLPAMLPSSRPGI